MREIKAQQITDVVKNLCIKANCYLPADVKKRIEALRAAEPWPQAQEVLDRIIENYNIAEEGARPICQDTGLACVFVKVGQDVHIDGNLNDAINEGVRQGYTEGYLRKSVVRDPLDRVNTGDNTPAMIYYDIVPGDKVEITIAPKGAGSENMSQIKMLKPSDGVQGVKDFVLWAVENAGPNPCPPSLSALASAAPSTRPLSLPRRHLPVTLTSATPIPSGLTWKKSCLRRSTLSASARRVSAARPLLCA